MKFVNIVIPMAGRGSRFSDAGYVDPKPLINVRKKAMIELVAENLTPKKYDCKFIFICQEEILDNLKFQKFISEFSIKHEIIPINYITGGAAETVLLAEHLINNDDQLMIANCDQYIDIDIDDYLDFASQSESCIMTMKANHPKWSYIKYKDNIIIDVVEKKVVSDDATVGIYNFSSGNLFLKGAHMMIKKDKKVNGEYYVAPVYKELIDEEVDVRTYDITGKMYGLGTPEDLSLFLTKYPY